MAGSIFDVVEGGLDLSLLTSLILGLVVFIVLFEFLLHHLDHAVAQHTHYMKMLGKIYKELMILGFISFTLLMIIQFHDLPQKAFLMFEFVHVWIFLVAVFFVMHAVSFMIVAKKTKRHWDACAHFSIGDILEKFKNEGFPDLSPWRVFLFGRGQLFAEMEFHLIKDLYLTTFDLPRHFDYAKYLRRAMSEHIIEHLDVKESTWGLLLIVLIVNWFRLLIEDATGSKDVQEVDVQDKSTLMWCFIIGYLLLFWDIGLLIHTRITKNRLLAKAQCYSVNQMPVVLNEKLNASRVCGRVSSPSLYRNVSMFNMASPNSIKGRRSGRLSNSASPANGHNSNASPDSKSNNAYNHNNNGNNHNSSTCNSPRQSQFNQQNVCSDSELSEGIYVFNLEIIWKKQHEVLMLFQCFYLGLLILVNIKSMFLQFHPAGAIAFFIFTLVPQLLIAFVISPAVIKNEVFVKAACQRNNHIIKQVAAHQAETLQLTHEVSQLFQAELLIRGGTEQHLVEMFEEMDTEMTGYISKAALHTALQQLDYFLQPRDLRRLCRHLDKKQTGFINFGVFRSLVMNEEGSVSRDFHKEFLLTDDADEDISIDDNPVELAATTEDRTSGPGTGHGHHAKHPSSSSHSRTLSERMSVKARKRISTIQQRNSQLLHDTNLVDQGNHHKKNNSSYLVTPSLAPLPEPSSLSNKAPAMKQMPLISDGPGTLSPFEQEEDKGNSHNSRSSSSSKGHKRTMSAQARGPIRFEQQFHMAHCFGGLRVRCNACEEKVSITSASQHAEECPAIINGKQSNKTTDPLSPDYTLTRKPRRLSSISFRPEMSVDNLQPIRSPRQLKSPASPSPSSPFASSHHTGSDKSSGPFQMMRGQLPPPIPENDDERLSEEARVDVNRISGKPVALTDL